MGLGTTCCCVETKRGACCLPDGSCVDIDGDTPQGTCEDIEGGVWQGFDTACVFLDCPGTLPTEACCFDDGSCTDEAAVRCLIRGGVPQGAGTQCGPFSCLDASICRVCNVGVDLQTVGVEVEVTYSEFGRSAIIDPNQVQPPFGFITEEEFDAVNQRHTLRAGIDLTGGPRPPPVTCDFLATTLGGGFPIFITIRVSGNDLFTTLTTTVRRAFWQDSLRFIATFDPAASCFSPHGPLANENQQQNGGGSMTWHGARVI